MEITLTLWLTNKSVDPFQTKAQLRATAKILQILYETQ